LGKRKRVDCCSVCSYLQVGDTEVMLGSGMINCPCGAKIFVTDGTVTKRFEGEDTKC
jgi:hypothetical protein